MLLNLLYMTVCLNPKAKGVMDAAKYLAGWMAQSVRGLATCPEGLEFESQQTLSF